MLERRRDYLKIEKDIVSCALFMLDILFNTNTVGRAPPAVCVCVCVDVLDCILL